ncbi:MAG: TMEM175 family protein [Chloroflexota bacterium]
MPFRLRRGAPTESGRLEAFSDGVFAVAITLLALDLARIHADPGATPPVTLFKSLADQWPTLLAFAGAFAFVGVAWTNHHNVFVRVKAVSRSLNAANLLLLAGVAVVPWATTNLAEALGSSGTEPGREAILLYAAVTTAGAITWGLLFHVLASNPDLLDDPEHAHGFATDRAGSLIGMGATAGAAAVGWLLSPIVGTMLLALVPVLFAVASEGFERTGQHLPPTSGTT